MYTPEFAGNVVVACAILHNIRLMHRIAEQEALLDMEVDDEDANLVAPAVEPVGVLAPPEEQEAPVDGERLAIARAIRAGIVRDRFGL